MMFDCMLFNCIQFDNRMYRIFIRIVIKCMDDVRYILLYVLYRIPQTLHDVIAHIAQIPYLVNFLTISQKLQNSYNRYNLSK